MLNWLILLNLEAAPKEITEDHGRSKFTAQYLPLTYPLPEMAFFR